MCLFLLYISALACRAGLQSVRFPPNSGDLNPIETVWARLRHDLSTRERGDLTAGRTLSTGQFKLRVSQLLTSYSERKVGERFNYYERLLRDVPTRLAKCRANKFGPCGKWQLGRLLRHLCEFGAQFALRAFGSTFASPV